MIWAKGTIARGLFRNEINEEEIRNIFTRYGTIKRFKFFEKDRKMALIEMDTIEQAIAALIVSFIPRRETEIVEHLFV